MEAGAEVQRVVGLVATMPDGVDLVADAWVPAGAGPWPVLLQRLPYGRAVASTPVLPHPAWFARRGYAVVVQDSRGRGDSGGVFEPFATEAADGEASVAWASRLPFADGRVVAYGFSYQGLAALATAARRPTALVGVAALMCSADPAEGWTHEGGCLRWPFVTAWASQLAGLTAGADPPPVVLDALPATGALGPTPPPWFADWLGHPPDDPWWDARRVDLAAIAVPVFTVLGWFDDFSSGAAAVVAATGAEVVGGPWSHMPWGSRAGGVDLGERAGPGPVAGALADFLARTLAGGARPAERARWYAPGAGWRTSPTWPPATVARRYLATSAADPCSRHGDGRLVPDGEGDADRGRPGGGGLPATIVVEPLVPYPGGPVAWGDEAEGEERRDVLCFTTDPLPGPVLLAGAPTVVVRTRCDRPTHDVVVTLTVVEPAGPSRALTGTTRRVAPDGDGGWRDHELVLRPVAWQVPVGARLRIDVSGARFPEYDRNPHTAVAPVHAARGDTVVATVEVAGVALTLPVVDDE